MIEITKEEKKIITAAFPDTVVRRTVKQKSKRGRYFMTEDPDQMRLLHSLRSGKSVLIDKGE